jgi:hypothetical protein
MAIGRPDNRRPAFKPQSAYDAPNDFGTKDGKCPSHVVMSCEKLLASARHSNAVFAYSRVIFVRWPATVAARPLAERPSRVEQLLKITL